MKNTDHLTLYFYKTCPFCIKVERFLAEKGLEISIVNLDDDMALVEELYHKTGSAQAPCLKINDSYMRESDDIIAYLDHHF